MLCSLQVRAMDPEDKYPFLRCHSGVRAGSGSYFSVDARSKIATWGVCNWAVFAPFTPYLLL